MALSDPIEAEVVGDERNKAVRQARPVGGYPPLLTPEKAAWLAWGLIGGFTVGMIVVYVVRKKL